MTPLNFRKKYKMDEETFEKHKRIEHHPLNEAIEDVIYYLEDYDRFNSENKINKIDIDMSKDLGEFEKNFKNIINVGDAFDLLIEDNKDILEELQEEIGYNYCKTIKCIFFGYGYIFWV